MGTSTVKKKKKILKLIRKKSQRIVLHFVWDVFCR